MDFDPIELIKDDSKSSKGDETFCLLRFFLPLVHKIYVLYIWSTLESATDRMLESTRLTILLIAQSISVQLSRSKIIIRRLWAAKLPVSSVFCSHWFTILTYYIYGVQYSRIGHRPDARVETEQQ